MTAVKQFGRVALTLGVTIVCLAIAIMVMRRYPSSALLQLFVVAAVVFAAYLAGSRWIEQRHPPELTARRGIPDLIGGVAMGLALFSVVIGVMSAVDVYRFAGLGTTTGLGAGAAAAMLQASLELFGMATSGGPAKPGLINGTVHGPALLTGSAFGPEASIIAVIICLIAATGLLGRVVRRVSAAG